MSLTLDIRHQLDGFAIEARFSADTGITTLFGRSGSGKSTLIRMISGLLKPDTGTITFDGEVLLDTAKGIFVPPHRRQFGIVFQEPRLFPHLSVRQNLLYGARFQTASNPSLPMDRIIALLGIENLLGRRPETLSGGEKQRVSIGRALLSSPRLLLMDEPFSALDDKRKAEILPYIERLRDELALPMIYVSHSVPEVIRLSNQVIVLDNGQIRQTGSAADLLSNPDLSQISGRRELGAVLDVLVEGNEGVSGLTRLQTNGLLLLVPGIAGRPGEVLRIHIPARDVMLATTRPENISALNIAEGLVSHVEHGADHMATVTLSCGATRLFSRITSASAERLDLQPGRTVFAIIKSVALEQG